METERREIRMIGLGVMGRNMLLNMADHGFPVAGYDKEPGKVEALPRSIEQLVHAIAEFPALRIDFVSCQEALDTKFGRAGANSFARNCSAISAHSRAGESGRFCAGARWWNVSREARIMRAAFANRSYIEQWADDIYVREEIDGRWERCALSELPPIMAMRR